jgi:hypothetical protein
MDWLVRDQQLSVKDYDDLMMDRSMMLDVRISFFESMEMIGKLTNYQDLEYTKSIFRYTRGVDSLLAFVRNVCLRLSNSEYENYWQRAIDEYDSFLRHRVKDITPPTEKNSSKKRTREQRAKIAGSAPSKKRSENGSAEEILETTPVKRAKKQSPIADTDTDLFEEIDEFLRDIPLEEEEEQLDVTLKEFGLFDQFYEKDKGRYQSPIADTNTDLVDEIDEFLKNSPFEDLREEEEQFDVTLQEYGLFDQFYGKG